jgi:anti-sigma-K factor RskA
MNPESSHPREEEAIAYAFGSMDAAARTSFESEMKADASLRTLVQELQASAASLAFDTPQQSAPQDLRASILARTATMPQESVVRRPAIAPSRAPSTRTNPWKWTTLAASIALLGGAIGGIQVYQAEKVASAINQEALNSQIQNLRSEVDGMKARLYTAVTETTKLRQVLETQVAEANKTAQLHQAELAQRTQREEVLKQELAKLTKTNELAKIQIATLQTNLDQYKQGVAVVVWNSDTQTGILKLEKMPPVEQGKDYQLWVVDPSKNTPVNAGIVQVDDKGFAKVEFKPVVEIEKANNFALSVEKEGGVPENEGPIVLISP